MYKIKHAVVAALNRTKFCGHRERQNRKHEDGVYVLSYIFLSATSWGFEPEFEIYIILIYETTISIQIPMFRLQNLVSKELWKLPNTPEWHTTRVSNVSSLVFLFPYTPTIFPYTSNFYSNAKVIAGLLCRWYHNHVDILKQLYLICHCNTFVTCTWILNALSAWDLYTSDRTEGTLNRSKPFHTR